MLLDPVSALHSNMFLLIPAGTFRKKIREPNFTFQYVSINTEPGMERVTYSGSLHSNMFLLIRQSDRLFLPSNRTLHSNMFLLILGTGRYQFDASGFTFQYVSINTADRA